MAEQAIAHLQKILEATRSSGGGGAGHAPPPTVTAISSGGLNGSYAAANGHDEDVLPLTAVSPAAKRPRLNSTQLLQPSQDTVPPSSSSSTASSASSLHQPCPRGVAVRCASCESKDTEIRALSSRVEALQEHIRKHCFAIAPATATTAAAAATATIIPTSVQIPILTSQTVRG